jgi:hypothetical protein
MTKVSINPPDKPAGFRIRQNWWGKPHPTIEEFGKTFCKKNVWRLKSLRYEG